MNCLQYARKNQPHRFTIDSVTQKWVSLSLLVQKTIVIFSYMESRRRADRRSIINAACEQNQHIFSTLCGYYDLASLLYTTDPLMLPNNVFIVRIPYVDTFSTHFRGRCSCSWMELMNSLGVRGMASWTSERKGQKFLRTKDHKGEWELEAVEEGGRGWESGLKQQRSRFFRLSVSS